MTPDQAKLIQDHAKAELVRMAETVDELFAHSSNSFNNDGAYRGALIQTLAAIELSYVKRTG